jgi:hypothetical protein
LSYRFPASVLADWPVSGAQSAVSRLGILKIPTSAHETEIIPLPASAVNRCGAIGKKNSNNSLRPASIIQPQKTLRGFAAACFKNRSGRLRAKGGTPAMMVEMYERCAGSRFSRSPSHSRRARKQKKPEAAHSL